MSDGQASASYNLIRLALPVLFPSWRFFETIGASPRIEVFDEGVWRDPLPLPDRLGLLRIAVTLIWNPSRNEALYLVALAERALAEPDGPAQTLLSDRLAKRHTTGHYRIWLETGAGRELAYESPGDER